MFTTRGLMVDMKNRFLFLLAPLVLILLIQPLTAQGVIPSLVLRILNLFLIVGAFGILRRRRTLLVTAVVLFIVATVAIPGQEAGDSPLFTTVGVLAIVAAMAMTTVYIALETVHEREVTLDTLLGALCVYLLIGMSSTFLYELMEFLQPGSFTNLGGLTERQVAAELNYFSLVTLTTLGYGDIAPVAPVARTLTTLEAVPGQFFVAAVVGLLVGRRTSRPTPGNATDTTDGGPLDRP